VTVNVPISYLDAIEKLVGDNGLYPSRSELIRCAVRKFLIKELKTIKTLMNKQKQPSETGTVNDTDKELVHIPIEKKDKNSDEPIREFKTYKIVRKLEF
jgi:Arc/MetJ-type ribon-helix-helix transcriptional regulator